MTFPEIFQSNYETEDMSNANAFLTDVAPQLVDDYGYAKEDVVLRPDDILTSLAGFDELESKMRGFECNEFSGAYRQFSQSLGSIPGLELSLGRISQAPESGDSDTLHSRLLDTVQQHAKALSQAIAAALSTLIPSLRSAYRWSIAKAKAISNRLRSNLPSSMNADMTVAYDWCAEKACISARSARSVAHIAYQALVRFCGWVRDLAVMAVSQIGSLLDRADRGITTMIFGDQTAFIQSVRLRHYIDISVPLNSFKEIGGYIYADVIISSPADVETLIREIEGIGEFI